MNISDEKMFAGAYKWKGGGCGWGETILEDVQASTFCRSHHGPHVACEGWTKPLLPLWTMTEFIYERVLHVDQINTHIMTWAPLWPFVIHDDWPLHLLIFIITNHASILRQWVVVCVGFIGRCNRFAFNSRVPARTKARRWLVRLFRFLCWRFWAVESG